VHRPELIEANLRQQRLKQLPGLPGEPSAPAVIVHGGSFPEDAGGEPRDETGAGGLKRWGYGLTADARTVRSGAERTAAALADLPGDSGPETRSWQEREDGARRPLSGHLTPHPLSNLFSIHSPTLRPSSGR